MICFKYNLQSIAEKNVKFDVILFQNLNISSFCYLFGYILHFFQLSPRPFFHLILFYFCVLQSQTAKIYCKKWEVEQQYKKIVGCHMLNYWILPFSEIGVSKVCILRVHHFDEKTGDYRISTQCFC